MNICGMRLDEEVSRSACCCSGTAKAWGPNCEQCPDKGTEEHKMVCPGGYGFKPNPETAILEDINECEEMENMCKNGRCSNTFGSFMCTCEDGFELDSSHMMCVDVNECKQNPSICGTGNCVNLAGSYECDCPPDYMVSQDGRECIDMRKERCYMKFADNSCSQPMTQPQTRMVCCCSMGAAWGVGCEECPADGSQEYRRLCGQAGPGMMVDPMTGTRTEINACELMPGACQHGSCVNTVGSFRCECNNGYEFDEDSHQCVDLNECLQSPCSGNSECVNIPGSYTCKCPEGYKLGPTGRDCRDIDECSEIQGMCDNGECRNLAGSFQCTCKEGFTLTSARDSCVDTDECWNNPGICGNGTCHNHVGGYTCKCNPGFKLAAGQVCEDVDECRIDYNLCRHGRCRNTPGSFSCECADGFQLSADGRTCEDKNECEDPNFCPPPGACDNVMGSSVCTCPVGFKLDAQGAVCLDVNECVEDKTFCVDGFCRNRDGGADCSCQDGWSLDASGRQCLDQRQGRCFDQYRNVFTIQIFYSFSVLKSIHNVFLFLAKFSLSRSLSQTPFLLLFYLFFFLLFFVSIIILSTNLNKFTVIQHNHPCCTIILLYCKLSLVEQAGHMSSAAARRPHPQIMLLHHGPSMGG